MISDIKLQKSTYDKSYGFSGQIIDNDTMMITFVNRKKNFINGFLHEIIEASIILSIKKILPKQKIINGFLNVKDTYYSVTHIMSALSIPFYDFNKELERNLI